MLPETKILGRGHPAPEAAFDPLRAALPWIKQVEGDLRAPTSQLVFQQGEGKRRLRFQVKITAEREGDRFKLVLQIKRFRANEFFSLVGAVGFLVAIGFSRPEALFFAVPVVVLIGAIRFGYVWHHARLATAAFSLPYAEDKKAPAPLSQT